jgi:hypothetical protein
MVPVLAVILAFLSVDAFSQPEGKLTGPDFSGHYKLVSARGAASGTAPRAIQIAQSGRWFRVGVVVENQTQWTVFPITTEWVEDGGKGQVKAFFDGDALIAERAKGKAAGRYYRQLDRWTFLGRDSVRICRDAYFRESLWQEHERHGCATYQRQ